MSSARRFPYFLPCLLAVACHQVASAQSTCAGASSDHRLFYTVSGAAGGGSASPSLQFDDAPVLVAGSDRPGNLSAYVTIIRTGDTRANQFKEAPLSAGAGSVSASTASAQGSAAAESVASSDQNSLLVGKARAVAVHTPTDKVFQSTSQPALSRAFVLGPFSKVSFTYTAEIAVELDQLRATPASTLAGAMATVLLGVGPVGKDGQAKPTFTHRELVLTRGDVSSSSSTERRTTAVQVVRSIENTTATPMRAAVVTYAALEAAVNTAPIPMVSSVLDLLDASEEDQFEGTRSPPASSRAAVLCRPS